MASEISFRPIARDAMIDFTKKASIGEIMTMNYDVGHRYNVFTAIKTSKTKVKCYNISKWAWRADFQKPFLELTKDYIKLINYEDGNRWSHCDVLRGFFRLGLIPEHKAWYQIPKQDKDKLNGQHQLDWEEQRNRYKLGGQETNSRVYRYPGSNKYFEKGTEAHKPLNGDGIGLKYLRCAHVANMNGSQVVPYNNMKFDWNGNLISRVPKSSKDQLNKAIQEDRDRRSTLAKRNRANTNAVRLLKKAKETNDWSKLNVDHIWAFTNVTYRTELINHFGMDKVLDELEYYVKHKATIGGNKYELLSVTIPDYRPNASDETQEGNYLRMINPTTGETHIEGVANETKSWNGVPINSVGLALAWRNGETDGWNNEEHAQIKTRIAEGKDIADTFYTVPKTIT